MGKSNRLIGKVTQKVRLTSSMRVIIFGSIFLVIVFSVVLIYMNIGVSKKSHAALGMHGTKTVSTTNVVLNEFTTLSSNASAGATSITVTSSSLNGNSRFGAGNTLAAGELVTIIQMQGATMNTSSSSSSTWGAVTSYNSAGLLEFDEVAGVPNSTTINLVSPLANSYTAAGKVQVIRVPRYSSFTLNSGASLTTDSWNGSTGGIIAIEVNGTTTINGTIDVSGLGFRGGNVDNGSQSAATAITIFASTDSLDGGEKGEGIGGSKTVYDGLGGRYGRGAAANGGGGGNSHNAGGGGGANPGAIASWNGAGNPDTTTNSGWKTAWDLEGANFHTNVSTGGGRGGYTYSTKAKDPLTVAPGSSFWQGNNRLINGGYGGRPVDNSGNRVFMGGGGGAGDANNSAGTGGGNGGGIVFILSAGTISGTGIINANGANAFSTSTPASSGDASGGGGGGGSVVLYTNGASISSLTLNAKGGNGGGQNIATNEAEGMGGGGGGGYINTSNASGLTRNVNAGANGITNSAALTTFTPNGATVGSAGVIGAGPSNPYSGVIHLPITLKNFSGSIENNVVSLKWITASETNNDYFTIERGTDGKNFYSIGRVQGAGTTTFENSYHFIDDSPIKGGNYYRLSQTDFDGTTQQFNPIYLDFNATVDKFDISYCGPNPFNDFIIIDFSSPESGVTEIQLFNMMGQPIRHEETVTEKGMNSFIFSEMAQYKKGLYYIQLQQSGNKTKVIKLIKD